MKPYFTLLRTYQITVEIHEKLFDNLILEQAQLENYKQKPKANTLFVNAWQSRINERFDDLTNLELLHKKTPSLVEAHILEVEGRLNAKIKQLLSVIDSMAKMENYMFTKMYPDKAQVN